jgi:hypothetical protein
MIPYSIPLWTIFTKWPAPLGPQCRKPCSACAPRGPRGGVDPWRDRREQRRDPVDDLVLAAEHQAEAALDAPHAPAGAAVDVVDPLLAELVRVADVVEVVGVAAVDDHVAGLQHLGDGLDRLVGDLAGRHHYPDHARLLELGGELLERARPGHPVGLDGLDGVGAHVVAHAVVAVGHQPADDPGAHPAEPDHSQLHWCVSSHIRSFACPCRVWARFSALPGSVE